MDDEMLFNTALNTTQLTAILTNTGAYAPVSLPSTTISATASSTLDMQGTVTGSQFGGLALSAGRSRSRMWPPPATAWPSPPPSAPAAPPASC